MHACTHTHSHTHLHVHMQMYTHTCKHAHTHACMHSGAHTHMRMHTHTHTHTHMHTHLHIHTNTRTHTHTHACTHAHKQTHALSQAFPVVNQTLSIPNPSFPGAKGTTFDWVTARRITFATLGSWKRWAGGEWWQRLWAPCTAWPSRRTGRCWAGARTSKASSGRCPPPTWPSPPCCPPWRASSSSGPPAGRLRYKIQTHERFRITVFIRAKHRVLIVGGNPLFVLVSGTVWL